MTDRRRPGTPLTLHGYLEQLSSLVLLRRLQMPMLASGTDDTIVYANPSFADMVGRTGDELAGKTVVDFLHQDSHPEASARDVLTAAGTLVTWHHGEERPVRSVVTKSLLLRSDDPVLLVGFIDVTDWLWALGETTLPPLV